MNDVEFCFLFIFVEVVLFEILLPSLSSPKIS